MNAYVVTPTGELFIYTGVVKAIRYEVYLELTGANGSWIADVPRGWAVGWSRPTMTAPRAGDFADMKRALRAFDARTGRWSTEP